MPSLAELLGLVGNVLDTPGSVARGALSGNFGRALSGILSPEDRVTTEELTGTDDLLTNLGVGLLTDPTTYMGGLGVGKAALSANKFRKGANELIRALPEITDAVNAERATRTGPLLRKLLGDFGGDGAIAVEHGNPRQIYEAAPSLNRRLGYRDLPTTELTGRLDDISGRADFTKHINKQDTLGKTLDEVRAMDFSPLPGDLPKGAELGWTDVDGVDMDDDLIELGNKSDFASNARVMLNRPENPEPFKNWLTSPPYRGNPPSLSELLDPGAHMHGAGAAIESPVDKMLGYLDAWKNGSGPEYSNLGLDQLDESVLFRKLSKMPPEFQSAVMSKLQNSDPKFADKVQKIMDYWTKQ